MAGGEYLSSNAGIAYPFKQGQDLPAELVRLFADASISSQAYKAVLTKAEYSLATGLFSFVVNGVEYNVHPSSSKVYEVVSKAGSSFVIDVGYLDSLSDFSFSVSALFEESCIVVEAGGVDSIELYNGANDPRNAIITGDVSLCFGYNTEVEEYDAESSAISISASPGAGMGTVPCDYECEDDPNTAGEPLPTDNGNAVITADDCYEITASGNTIQIHGKCVACCQCQDYIDVINILKGVAGRVKETKKDLTEDKTGVYFDFIHKQALSVHPDLHVQLDIAPDADIASVAYNGKPAKGFNDWQSFRVTCTITNLSGVPCFIGTPNFDWDAGDVCRGIGSLSSFYTLDGKHVGANDCVIGGIIASVCLTNGYLMQGSRVVRRDAGPNDPNGWVAYSRSRGPALRPKTTDKNSVKYTQPITRTTPGLEGRIKSNADIAVAECTSQAIDDLNAGKNPSGLLSWGMEYTNAIAKKVSSSSLDSAATSYGFLAPSGYSFTISNAYVFPGKRMGDIKSIIALFTGYAYSPMLAYSMAYNFAESEVGSRKTKDGTVYYNTWVEGRHKVDPSRLWRRIGAFAAYDVTNGKQLYRGADDTKWS